jgi:putative DNA-invertase from lambdoid prophage Rac
VARGVARDPYRRNRWLVPSLIDQPLGPVSQADSLRTEPTTAQRRGFTRMLDRLEPSDVLGVTKLAHLGRNAMDVSSTVTMLAELGVRVHCRALGGVDLTSSTGKLTMTVINAVADFQRDLLIERTQVGLSRTKAEGKALGRPPSLTDDQRKAVARRLKEGATVSALAREFNTSRNTITRMRDAKARTVTRLRATRP